MESIFFLFLFPNENHNFISFFFHYFGRKIFFEKFDNEKKNKLRNWILFFLTIMCYMMMKVGSFIQFFHLLFFRKKKNCKCHQFFIDLRGEGEEKHEQKKMETCYSHQQLQYLIFFLVIIGILSIYYLFIEPVSF